MTLCIQDPTDPNSEYLIDTLLEASNGATRGGGAFAFLSRGGVQLFLRDPGFAAFASAGAFDLVVGVDAITDTAAILALDAVRADLPSLAASVHIPTHPRSIFHPKFIWFEKPGGGVLVTGSGNLTAGGLRWNIEAFNVTALNNREVRAVAGQWDALKARSAANLFATADPMVLARLQRNAEHRQWERSRPPGPPLPRPGITPPAVLGEVEVEAGAHADVDALPAVTAQTEVLIAELSRSRKEFDQANFHKEIFFGFFGVSTTVTRTTYFFHVLADGTLEQERDRRAVSSKSKNYRFELKATKGVTYPSNGKPIGVFVRVASRTFVYTLAMPGDAAHGALTGLLHAARPNPGHKMRQEIFTAAQVRAAWPRSPLWQPLSI